MSVMLPKSVAQKLAEASKRSLLATIVQHHFIVKLHLSVPAQSFLPPPKIESQIVSLVNRGTDKTDSVQNHWSDFSRFLKVSYSQPRRLLKNNLKGYLTGSSGRINQMLDDLNLNRLIRPEKLN